MALNNTAREKMLQIIEAKKQGNGKNGKSDRPEKSIQGTSKPKKMKKNGGLFDK
ncbi:hypothetical protein [Proteiniclasticum sp.]|uniref:hypothetical protein n=1 Tax=Proteiniclasticum sp. TaxID=2053595 RepID=UPI0026011062|nr:hypothetical protein [Proteiniclasticum sp.]